MKSSIAASFSRGLALLLTTAASAQPFYVAPDGADTNPGTLVRPFATLSRAQQAVRQQPGTVFLRGGTYHLPATLVFSAQDSGTKEKPIVFQAYENEQPVISGGVRLQKPVWKPGANGVWTTQVPAGLRTEEIFVNGERQILARYPNFDPKAAYFDGFAVDAISPERAARWVDPAGGYFHAMHPNLWGDFTWIITGKDATGNVTREGGWQNNRGGAVHDKIRFVENIFEELDAPGEWFLDAKTHTLHFIPPAGLDLATATVEATRLRSLVEFRGSETKPVRFVTLRGLTFRHAARTVMDTKEPLLRTDWAIYRGGAIFFEGAEDCALEHGFIDQVGGNAIFINLYNRRIAIRGCHIARAGASGVCFVGDPKAARSPLFHYDQVNKLEDIDLTPGPLNNNYPADCVVEDCLIYLTGRVEKQTAGVNIDLAQSIAVRHCSIYDMPRAGINIGDGCWGGHVVEFCDVFDTVKETGDHGSFNSWGRDRFWQADINKVNAWVKEVPTLPSLDVVKPITLRNNRWRCDHGWDIDLDDGSSFYVIQNNLCLRGGIKNREGYNRLVENNVMVGNGFHPHVWFNPSGDVFRRNIVWRDYQPARMHAPPWGEEFDRNLLHRTDADPSPATRMQRQSGRDRNSIVADAQFIDPASGDYRVKDGSPALALGFVNFAMDQFGVRKATLKAIARTPVLPAAKSAAPATPAPSNAHDFAPRDWLGASVRNIASEGEMSAFGLPGVAGVLVLDVPASSPLAAAGLQKNDVILSIDNAKTPDVAALLQQTTASAKSGQPVRIGVSRGQKLTTLTLAAIAPTPAATGQPAAPASPSTTAPKGGDIVPPPPPRRAGLGISGPGAFHSGRWEQMNRRVSGSAVQSGLIPDLKPLIPATQLRDTVVIVGGDGNYYLTGSSGDDIWDHNDGVELWRSPDLKTWTHVGLVWTFEKDATWQKDWRWHNKPVRALWAPELHYIKRLKNYFITLSMPPGGRGILRSTSGKPEGPYVNALANDARLAEDIDASLFEDDDGAVYLVYGGGWVARMKDDLSGLAEEPRKPALLHPDKNPAHHAETCPPRRDCSDIGREGAFLFKKDGRYYLTAADTYQGRYSSLVAISDNVYGPYDHRHEAVPCGGGGDYFRDKEGNWWCTYFGNDNQSPFREKPAIVRVEFDAAGLIRVAKSQPDFVLNRPQSP